MKALSCNNGIALDCNVCMAMIPLNSLDGEGDKVITKVGSLNLQLPYLFNPIVNHWISNASKLLRDLLMIGYPHFNLLCKKRCIRNFMLFKLINRRVYRIIKNIHKCRHSHTLWRIISDMLASHFIC